VLKLSKREIDVLTELKSPTPDLKLVALRLGVEPNTIAVHLRNIRKKYKEAKQFTNLLDNMKGNYPSVSYYLRYKRSPMESKRNDGG